MEALSLPGFVSYYTPMCAQARKTEIADLLLGHVMKCACFCVDVKK